MKEEIENLLTEFETEQKSILKKLQEKSKIQNSGKESLGEWTQKIVSVVRISELASEFGVSECPFCNYPIDFDDSTGFFICRKAKYSGRKDCDFAGNIVNFCERFSNW